MAREEGGGKGERVILPHLLKWKKGERKGHGGPKKKKREASYTL